MKTDEQLAKLAKTAVAKVIFLTSTLNEEISAHLRASAGNTANPSISNHIWMEIAYLGCHLLVKKIAVGMELDERKKFNHLFKKEFMSTAIDSAFKLETLEKEGIAFMLEGDYEDRQRMYEENKGDIALLFKNQFKKSLIGQSGNAKTAESISLQDSIMSKASSLFGFKSQSSGGSLFSDNILTSISEGAVKVFEAATI